MRIARSLVCYLVIAGTWGLASLSCSAAAADATCDRECLIGHIDRYLDALVKHDPSTLPIAAAVKATENGQPVILGEGLWTTAKSIKAREYFVEPQAGQVACCALVDDGDRSAILALRLRVVDGKIAESETIVTHRGDHALFSADAVVIPKPLYDARVAPGERTSREAMIAAVNSYFDGIEQHNGDKVPFHADCVRIENGVQTGGRGSRGANIKEGMKNFTYIPRVRDRRFPIVDEERGMVYSVIMFDMPGRTQTAEVDGKAVELEAFQRATRSLLLVEVFKVVGGQLREIEAFMLNRPLGAPTGWND